ncbi:phospholipase [Actinomyces sp. Chiba101]|uniref:Predicted phospholipase, patatin/cPLA2 family n=1 Tax=Actinomyces denticolens TaxID=52767 RepID=A0ABY1IFR1_9ACTO|nr:MULTISPECIES: patatin family protein [Actinomyces]BAW93900.1 phospholipase [Actinomyces sp. Chiba101]GAV93845.1 phospholipase [Actinomyces denticolens]SHJ11160.1 Predicted phospholipase, patatin/cPLA2 family [Actinomyces denticolens]SUU74404.1 Patatin-like phospholipase [Actinomyces denticolens]
MTSRNQQPGYYPYGHPLHAPAPVTARIDDVALVFEGGGMRGAYTGALVRALLEEGLEFGWVGGISAGATNAVNMVTRDTWRAREAYLGMPLLGDAGGWGSFARGRGYFNSDRIYHHTSAEDEEMPVDWPTLEASDVELVLGAFRCDTGEQVYFHRSDMPAPADLLARAQASASMPVLMPVVEIDGAPYLDGALGPTGGFATDAALADGYERLLVISTRPAGYRKPEEKRPEVYRRLLRQHPAAAEALIERPRHYNAALEDLERRCAEGSAYLYRPDRMDIANGELRYDRLTTAFEAGLVQARREMPAIRAFLGI